MIRVFLTAWPLPSSSVPAAITMRLAVVACALASRGRPAPSKQAMTRSGLDDRIAGSPTQSVGRLHITRCATATSLTQRRGGLRYDGWMVRRDDDRNPDPVRVRNLPSRCEDPAGESPASGSAGAPRSRPAAEGETPTAEAGRRKRARQRKLFSTKQARGPQHQVKPAASTDEQSESRAGHFAAKATSLARAPERGEDLGGVWGAARVQGSSRNTRGPSAQPSSRLGGSNRPGAKAAIAQRKSDGVIVPTMAATNNAAGGKGHERGHVGEEGKRKGMTGRTGSNSPGGRRPPDNVRQLRRRLWVAAKRSLECRFHALYDRMWRGDILREAWKRVKQNRGSAGLDAQTIAEVEQYGAERSSRSWAACCERASTGRARP